MKLYLTRLVPQGWKSQRQKESRRQREVERGQPSKVQRSSRSAERFDWKEAEHIEPQRLQSILDMLQLR